MYRTFDNQMLARGKGIPCTGASVAGRAKKHLAKPEDDPNVGHLIVDFLTLVQRLNRNCDFGKRNAVYEFGFVQHLQNPDAGFWV
jgi:hypothetical protein